MESRGIFQIRPRFGDQLLMSALLHDTAMVDHENLIGVTHRFQPVRDHDDRLIARQRLDRPLQPVFVFRIDVRRRFVQDDNGRVFQHGAGNGDALPLPPPRPSPRRVPCECFPGRYTTSFA